MTMPKRLNSSSDLSELIQEAYGSPVQLAKILDLAIEMLFYLEEDTFDRKDVQHVASAIRAICEALRQGD
ncbi:MULTISPECIES: hypothetical protein [Flavobacteriaceae]|uniref:hypothetical protein n=1 Tax=Flavobacteriaceae TaxID=49546 RepID=UPI001FE2F6D6|nr:MULTISPECIES: hypothetical protein [Allomuricauda]